MTDISSAAKFLKVKVDTLIARAAGRRVSILADTRLCSSLMVETFGCTEADGIPHKKAYRGMLYFLQWLVSVAVVGGAGFAIGYHLLHPLPEWLRPSGKGALYWSIVGNIFWALFLITWGSVALIKSYSKESLRGVTKGLISDPHIESFQQSGHTVFRVFASVLYKVLDREYFGDYSGFGATVGERATSIPPKVERTLSRMPDGAEVPVYYHIDHPARFSLENPARDRVMGFALGTAATLIAFSFFALSGALFRLI
jgi:hypothetical protein